MTTIRETDLLSRLYQGKVGDAYDLGDCLLFMVATDCTSALDVALPTVIPGGAQSSARFPPCGST